MSCKVTFVELSVVYHAAPLVSGYLEACCRQDPAIAGACSFEKISLPIETSYEEVFARLEKSAGDVYAFSTYVWNARMVRRLIDELATSRPSAQFILGGPQVMNQGKEYLDPRRENVFVCNGEGERTFKNFMAQLISTRDFSSVRGLSFYRGGELVTTEPEPRITDLSEIPSPFLEGILNPKDYAYVVYETNRGCPFKCNYCYWGGAIGAKVYRYDEERIKRELEMITRSGCVYLFIADANWGMLQRDVDITRFLIDCKKKFDAPRSVYFCSSKNTPERVIAISKLFHEGGLLSMQPVSLQTMSPEALAAVDRSNIKSSSYTSLQAFLNDNEIASHVEMIWPLPGETLSSWQQGLADLCAMGTDSFIVYPLLLMNNVELNRKSAEFGLVTVPDPDPNSEARIVVETKWVGPDDYKEAVRYSYAAYSLHGMRGLRCLGKYLADSGAVSYRDLFTSFVSFCRTMPGAAYSRFCETTIDNNALLHFTNRGELVYRILHADREDFDRLLVAFVTAQSFWSDPQARLAFEIDLLNRPYLYRNAEFAPKPYAFEQLKVKEARDDGYLVEVPPASVASLARHLGLREDLTGASTLHVVHRRDQLPFMPGKTLRDHLVNATDFCHSVRNFVPLWRRSDGRAETARPRPLLVRRAARAG
jgi:hypothetical protein